MSVENKQIPEAGTFKNRLMKWLFTVFTCLLACVLYFHFFVNTASVEVELTVDQKTDFKIYWAAADQLYSEKNMAAAVATPERKHYSLFLTDIGKLARLRIDTHSYTGEASLKKLVIRQEGWAPIILATTEQFGKLVPLHQIAESRVDNDGLWVLSSGEDGNFELQLVPDRLGLDLGWLLLRLAAISAIVVCVLYCASPLAVNLRFVPVLLFGVWMLIITMAGISKDNSHPDEYVHMSAINYYQDHWLPPVIDDPAIRNTFSAYGVSRLNNGEVYYLFAGKFNMFLQTFNIPEHFSLRLFNVCLFGLIVLYTIRNRYARMVALPFLVSSQIWYIFSYCASDAFALFFAFLAACELIDPKSLLHRYLKGDGWGFKLLGFVVLSILLGIIFLLKKNYLPFVVFFYLVLAVKLFFTEEFFWEKKAAILRLCLITFVGLSIFGLRVGADYFVNGFDREEKIVRLQEEMAHSWYKPGTELHKKHISLYREARGATLEEIVKIDRWFEKTFRSSFGVFGYFTISGTQVYYDLVRWSGVMLLVLFLATFVRGGGLIGSGLAFAGLGISVGLIGIALYHSWVIDFQPQGRYLFPIIPIIGILCGWNSTTMNQRLLILGLTPMFLLAMYGFIFEALMRIPRVVFL
ncbi:MAG: hypothetical protein KJ630_13095 [Proteobacteria bacterium]|nr:hypothetical protein [Pseudomonadota bacterium]